MPRLPRYEAAPLDWFAVRFWLIAVLLVAVEVAFFVAVGMSA